MRAGRLHAAGRALEASRRGWDQIEASDCQQVVSNGPTRGLASHHGAWSHTSSVSRADVVPREAAAGLVKGCGWHGMQGVRGSNPLSSTPGQRPSPPSTARESWRSRSRYAATAVAQADPSPTASVTPALLAGVASRSDLPMRSPRAWERSGGIRSRLHPYVSGRGAGPEGVATCGFFLPLCPLVLDGDRGFPLPCGPSADRATQLVRSLLRPRPRRSSEPGLTGTPGTQALAVAASRAHARGRRCSECRRSRAALDQGAGAPLPGLPRLRVASLGKRSRGRSALGGSSNHT